MDLLSQYKQDHPEAFREQKRQPLTDKYGRTYTDMIAFVMRLSGGRIRDARQATYVLLGFAIIVLIAAIFFFSGSLGINIDTTKDFVPAETPAR